MKTSLHPFIFKCTIYWPSIGKYLFLSVLPHKYVRVWEYELKMTLMLWWCCCHPPPQRTTEHWCGVSLSVTTLLVVRRLYATPHHHHTGPTIATLGIISSNLRVRSADHYYNKLCIVAKIIYQQSFHLVSCFSCWIYWQRMSSLYSAVWRIQWLYVLENFLHYWTKLTFSCLGLIM